MKYNLLTFSITELLEHYPWDRYDSLEVHVQKLVTHTIWKSGEPPENVETILVYTDNHDQTFGIYRNRKFARVWNPIGRAYYIDMNITNKLIQDYLETNAT